MSTRRVVLSSTTLVLLALGCGGAPPPSTPKTPTPTAKVEPPIDLAPVPEPEGLLAFGRTKNPDAILKSAGAWAHFPLPSGKDLLSSISDDAVGEVVDMSQPVDGAATLKPKARDPEPLFAFSIGVTSYETAKTKLATSHKLGAGPNGQFTIEGLSFSGDAKRSKSAGGDEDEEERPTCVLAPAAEPKGAGRIVCGEPQAIVALAPYMTRTLVKQTFKSDVHLEVRVAPIREPLNQLKGMLPMVARSVMGSGSPALRDFGEAIANEAIDFVGDTERMVIDTQLPEAGVDADVKIEFSKANSFVAKVATSNADKAGPPPPAFMHLPAETDLALYSKGSDPKLFDHPRELLGRVALELAADTSMPEAERKTLKELLVDKLMPLFTGPLVYGKGFDAAAVDKAIAARKAVKPGDVAGSEEAERVLGEQVMGWHLLQVSEPIAKVGAMLKEWPALWQRPSFQKWVKAESSAKMMAQVRTAPPPAGVTLPKDAVHLEVVIPRHDAIDAIDHKPSAAVAVDPKTKPVSGPVAIVKPPPVKKIPLKPVVLHVIAVPDAGATWLGLGFDAKLVATRAAAALSTAPDKDTLGKAAGADALKDAKANAGWLVTLRGLLVFTAMKRRDRTGYAALASMPNKGTTPITLTSVSAGPSAGAAGGAVTAHVRLPKAAIEDIVRAAMSR